MKQKLLEMTRKIRENQKINNIYDKVNWIIEFLLALLLNFCILNVIYKNNYSFQSTILLKIIIIIASLLIIAIAIINCIKYKKYIEKIFLTFVIPIGMMFLTFLMPMYAPDEFAHIVKSYDVSQGNIVANNEVEEGKYRVKVPEDLTKHSFANFKNYEDLIKALKEKTDYKNTVEIYTDAQSNCGIIYLPSAIGFFIARIFNINIIIAIYIARLCNFIFFIILGYFAIKIIPFGKIVLYVYMLTPMYLQQSASLSPDSMINIMIIFFMAYILNLSFRDDDIKKVDIAILVIGSMFIAIAKIVYIPILGIMLFLIKNKKISNKKKIFIITSCYIIAIITGLLYMTFSSKYIDERAYVQNNNINASEQIQNIINNPSKFLEILKNNLQTSTPEWLYDFAGWRLGWQSIENSLLLILFMLYLLFTAPFIENNEKVLNKKERILSVLIFLGIAMIIVVGFYITWTVVGAEYITGVQGRYFLPIGILFLLSLCLKNNYIKGANKIYYLAIIPINIFAVMNVVKYFIR